MIKWNFTKAHAPTEFEPLQLQLINHCNCSSQSIATAARKAIATAAHKPIATSAHNPLLTTHCNRSPQAIATAAHKLVQSQLTNTLQPQLLSASLSKLKKKIQLKLLPTTHKQERERIFRIFVHFSQTKSSMSHQAGARKDLQSILEQHHFFVLRSPQLTNKCNLQNTLQPQLLSASLSKLKKKIQLKLLPTTHKQERERIFRIWKHGAGKRGDFFQFHNGPSIVSTRLSHTKF
jgi:hypothetical protein